MRLTHLIASILLMPASLALATEAPEAPAVTSMTLKEATTRALADSRKIKKAKTDFAAAREATAVTRAAFLPTLEFQTNAGTLHDREPNIGDVAPPLTARDRNLYDAQLVLVQPLFAGFHDVNDWRAKNAAVSEEEWRLKSTALDVSVHVLELYFGLQLAQAELGAELQVAKLREQQLNEVKNRARQGRATEIEKLEAEYARRAQDPAIKTLQQEIRSKSLQLARLSGMPLDQKFRLSDALTDIGAVLGGAQVPDLAQAFEVAMRESPKLRLAEYTRQRINLEQSRDSAKHFPKLSFEAAAGYRANVRNDFGTQDSMHYSGMLKLSVPLFSGLSSFDERAVNAARLDAAAEDMALAREELLQELTDAFGNLELAESNIEMEKKNTEYTSRASANANDLFRSGRTTLASVLDSYSKDVTARRGYAKALYDRILALAKIRALTSP